MCDAVDIKDLLKKFPSGDVRVWRGDDWWLFRRPVLAGIAPRRGDYLEVSEISDVGYWRIRIRRKDGCVSRYELFGSKATPKWRTRDDQKVASLPEASRVIQKRLQKEERQSYLVAQREARRERLAQLQREADERAENAERTDP